jgi:EAL domain-containing protein (putative c-di-GMP-specific phosphodiesterase class I)
VLVRFLDGEDRHIAPADFLSAAERYQLMEDLDRWVVTHTLQQLAPHAAQLARAGARFAVNLSGQSLGSEQFLPFVQKRIVASGVPPEMLCFEITESVAVANLQRAQTFMHTLKRTGCKFSLDDFGTGLSSFAYLKLFPVDTLKIDGSFIRDLSSNVVSQSVVAAISEVARVMQLDSVAEFVQDEATLALLRKLGITWAQGYLFGQPASLSERIAGLASAESAAEAVAAPLRSRSVRRNQRH